MARVEAVIVAGGFGTRMLPLTRERPKHLLPVAGVPLVAHQLAALAAVGVDRVVLATSYHAEQFEPTLGDGSAWGVRLIYVREEEPLGTGGAIRNVASHLDSGQDDPVVVLNGDIVSDHDLPGQLARHRAEDADVTLHLVEVTDARPYGCVPTDATGRVEAFLEKDPDPVSQQINAGCYVFRRRVIDDVPAGRVVSVERETFPGLLRDGALVLGHLDPGYWIDVGRPEALRQVSCDVVTGRVSSPAYLRPPAPYVVATGASVHPSAVLGDGSAVGPGAVVEARATVTGSVVDEGAVIGEGARVIGSVLGRGARVAARSVCDGEVLGDHESR